MEREGKRCLHVYNAVSLETPVWHIDGCGLALDKEGRDKMPLLLSEMFLPSMCATTNK